MPRAAVLRRDDGASIVELSILLPVLALLLLATVPLVQTGVGYMTMTRAAAAGIRYAARADDNARHTMRYGADGTLVADGTLTRRPTADEVDAFVRDAARPLTPTAVTTYVSGIPADPSSALPGEAVAIVVTYEVSHGPLGAAANTIAALINPQSGGALPASMIVTVSASGREE